MMEQTQAPVPVGDVSAIDQVFHHVLRDILAGRYPPGVRLPAERDLARVLGTSRSTLREAMRRLTDWRVVKPRRGSGIEVQDVGEWSIEVLPSYLRHARTGPGQPGIVVVLRDVLVLRRTVLVDILRLIGERLPPGGVDESRRAAARAWSLRAEPSQFRRADLNVFRSMARIARFLPALWLLNRLAGVYLEIAESISADLGPPDDYLPVYERVFAALERRDTDAAVATMNSYLDRHDRRLQALFVSAVDRDFARP